MKTLSDKQFEKNKRKVLNTIETMLNEPLTPQYIPKCNWKEIADRNAKGLGTTFTSRTKDNLYCFECKGYDVDCRGYMV